MGKIIPPFKAEHCNAVSDRYYQERPTKCDEIFAVRRCVN
jgi:hypothetical protein